MKTVAIILAAGSGKRMGTSTKKQFLLLLDKPILFYSLKAFEESFIDEVILVTSPEDKQYVKEEIVEKYNFTKVTKIVEGGKERYHSVLNGLNSIDSADYIFVHDGARPLVDKDILERALEGVSKYKACVVGVPSKDTIKIANESGMVASTPNRNLVWNIQTPQVFDFQLIKEAYNNVVAREVELRANGVNITDDAMVLEEYSHHPVKLIVGAYENIKVTTKDDLVLAEEFLRRKIYEED